MPVHTDVGIYGKLPSHGDFLRRRVSDSFVTAWDTWLQASLAASRATLGDRWLEIYLTSPAWRFACASGAAGDAGVAGVMVPSVDRVGRYFPLTVVAALPAAANLVTVMTAAESFFELTEQLAIGTLEADAVDFDQFDRAVMALSGRLADLSAPRPSLEVGPGESAILSDALQTQWHLSTDSPQSIRAMLAQLAADRLQVLYHPLVLLWTHGSVMVDGSVLLTRGLPRPDTFASLLDGSWSERQWQSVGVRNERVPPNVDTLIDEVSPLGFRSAALSDVGCVRRVNQDAFLDRSEVGVWAVADGLGGHDHGEIASRMVCDALADVVPDGGFDQTVGTACERLQQVNDYLIRAAARSPHPGRTASTVVALLTRGADCAIIWVGDSRVYRWRSGRLEQLTRDHSLAADGRAGEGESNVVTRAVGGDSTLEFDVLRDRVRDGDRFLLCSDGLTRTVSDLEVSQTMEQMDIRVVVRELVDAALAKGAPDNVTALVVEARA